MSKKLVIIRTVTSISQTPLTSDFYGDSTEEEAIECEENLPIEEWAESFFEEKISWNTTVVAVDETETDDR
jgi:hypothetical protein